MVTHETKSYQILCSVVTEVASRLDVMDFKAFDLPAGLATPTIPLEYFTTELAISFRLEFQARSFGSDPSHHAT